MDEDSSNRKKKRKRGRSLIFKTCFLLPGSGYDHEDKVLASDDNLVYCDLTNTGTNGDSSVKTRSSSSRGRMSSIFKAVLFDTAMKKKMRGKKASESRNELTNSSFVPNDHTNSSLVPDEKIDKSLDKNIPNVVKVSEAGNDSTNNISNVVSSPPETNDASLVASSSVNTGSQMLTETKVTSPVASSSVNTGSQMLTERGVTPPVASSSANTRSRMTQRKVMSRVNSTNKKPPLPSVSRSMKHIPEKDSKPATFNNSTSRLCLFIVLVVFVSVVLWMSFTTTVTESSNHDSDQYTNTIVVGEEL